MKNIFILFIAFFSINFFFACSDDNDDSTDITISDDEAVTAIANSLSSSTAGLNQQTQSTILFVSEQDFLVLKKNGNKVNEIIHDTTIVFESQPGARIEFKYTFDYEYGYELVSLTPPVINVTVYYSMNGMYDAPRMSSDDNAEANFTIPIDNFNADEFIVKGTYVRNGSQNSKIGNKNSFTSKFDFAIETMVVNRAVKKITSGKASFSFTGSTTTGRNFSFTGTMVYNNDGTATLTLNSKEYNINLETGDVS